MSHDCQHCGETKAASDMVVRNGKPSRTCVECFRGKMSQRNKRGRAGGAAKHKSRAVELQAPEPEPIVISGPRLEILPGFGFRATIEDDRLSIEQDDSAGDTDNITLSRTEAKVLFAQFQEWAA